jgi:pimeloyl-ACP methyl ester carboxylesterase
MKGVEVYALDLPGHGESSGEPERSVDGFARRVLNWIDAQNIPRAIVAGHSMGGAITQRIALRAPDRTAGIVLVSTGARLRVHPKILELSSDEELFHDAAELVTAWSFSEGADERLQELGLERLRETKAEVANSDFHACNDFDIMEELVHIKVPTLVICGEEDRMTPVKYSRYLFEQIKGANLVVVPGAGHMVMLEEPAMVANSIYEFVFNLHSQMKRET